MTLKRKRKRPREQETGKLEEKKKKAMNPGIKKKKRTGRDEKAE